MNESEYSNVSPLYMQRLKIRVENALADIFNEPKSTDIEEYILRWYKEDAFGWKNFHVHYFGTMDEYMDVSATLAGMPNDLLIKIAADIGLETPGLLPCIPVMKNILNENNLNAYKNFDDAIKNVYDNPDYAVALASSTLEGIAKTMLNSTRPGENVDKQILPDLTKKVIKDMINDSDPLAPQEIKDLATQLRGLGHSISTLRSTKTMVHGKNCDEYVIDDELWAETVVNATATLGIFLWRLYERNCSISEDNTDDIPF